MYILENIKTYFYAIFKNFAINYFSQKKKIETK